MKNILINKQRIRQFLEVLFTALLLGTQTILNAGVAISIMTIPLLPYLFYLPTYLETNPNVVMFEIWVMLISSTFIVGRIVAFIGVTVLLIAAIQWLWNNHKKVGLFKTGLYGKVRHPQFTGIIITTMGLTVMSSTLGSFGSRQLVGLWLLQVLGYIAIAYFEERSLAKKFSEEYKAYKQKTPFLFPIKSPKKMPELLFTIVIIIIFCIILWLLPYDLIRVYSSKLYTAPLRP